VRFAKHDHVVETLAADRADESFNVSILPGRSGCDRMVTKAHCTDPLQEDCTIRGVSIPNGMSRRVVPRERLSDLARDPLHGWVCRHAKRHPKSSSVAHNDKTIRNLECDRRQDKEVDRRDVRKSALQYKQGHWKTVSMENSLVAGFEGGRRCRLIQ
jgi:hypothetical protein